MRVLILGGRAPVALDHARRFHAQGWRTYIADSVPCRLSGWSSSVDQTIRLPPPRYALTEFADALARLVATEKIDLILPTCEEVFYLSRIRSRLPAACNIFTSPFEQLQMLHSKWTFLSLAQGCGVDVPQSARVNDMSEARAWAAGRAVVLKPEFSRFGVHVRFYREGIPANTIALPPVGPWIVQSFCHGRELCSYSIAVGGQLRAHAVYEPKHRIGGSSSFYFDPVWEPQIEAFVAKLVNRICYTGQISFDWIRGTNDAISVLECNPRAISGLHLFSEADPLPAIICGQQAPSVILTSAPPRMISAVMLAVGLSNSLRAGRARSWFDDWRRASDVLAVSGDIKPALGALMDIGSFARIAIRAHTSLRSASTRDIEWDGETLVA